jgi:alpha-glucosidase
MAQALHRDPVWWRRGGIYQIYPRSFADTDGDGVGDLPGVVEHLDYLNDGTETSLGVEAIWLSPFYPSPMADFGYDIARYTDVDPRFGTLEDFDRLVEEAHRRGIKVIVDFVPNHTSDQHPWFEESRQGNHGNRRRDWYTWRDGRRPGEPPNNWRSAFKAVGPAWTFDPGSGQWYLHSFRPEQPDLNWDNPDVERAMHGILRFWCDRGADGFRIDVVHKIAKDPLLRDAIPGEPVPYEDWWPTIHERLRRLRAVTDEYPDTVLVGEVYLLDLERVVSYVNTGDELHLAHNFVFLRLPWDAAAFRAAIDGFEALSTEAAWPAWFLANHDHPRVASRFDTHGQGQRRARAVLLMLYVLCGTPFVYQGEELGLPDAEIPPDRVVDIDGRDPERAPIPWLRPSRAGPGAGFTAGEPWLPVVGEAETLCVESQTEDRDSTLALTRRLAWMRRNETVLQSGEQRSIQAGPDVLAWLRIGPDCRALLAIVNFSWKERRFGCPPDLPTGGTLQLSTDPAREEGDVDFGNLILAPSEAVLVRVQLPVHGQI